MTGENKNANPLSERTMFRIAVGTVTVLLGAVAVVVVGLLFAAVHFIGKVW